MSIKLKNIKNKEAIMFFKKTFIFLLLSFFISCLPYTYQTQYIDLDKSISLDMKVTNMVNEPIKNVDITIKNLDYNKFSVERDMQASPSMKRVSMNIIRAYSAITDSNGCARITINPFCGPIYSSDLYIFYKYSNILDCWDDYLAERYASVSSSAETLLRQYGKGEIEKCYFFADYVFEKDGYYEYSKRTLSIISKDSYNIKLEIKLIKPEDYFNEAFLKYINKSSFHYYKELIDTLRESSNLCSSDFNLHSIKEIYFKEKLYVQFDFNHMIIYNLNQLNKYKIGSRIFDDIVVKLLAPIHECNLPEKYAGYALSVNVKTKYFIEKDAKPQNIKYDFYFNRIYVEKYKIFDISGQSLVDNSYILMDGERIELNMQ